MSNTGTKTTVDTQVGVSTFEETYTYAMNKSIQIMLNYINNRGLDATKFSQMRDQLEDGLWVWITGRYIREFMIEVYDKETGDLVERFDLRYEITDPEDISDKEKQAMQEKKFEDYNEEIMEALSNHDAPPDGVTYRILVSTGPNSAGQEPPEVDGWGKSAPKDASHLDKAEAGDAIDAGPVEGTYEFWK
jgi:hypothetical protein